VTLRGGGGFGQGGAGIHLNRADPNNDNAAPGGINLFACAYVGCPSGVAPFNMAPFIANLGGIPPAFFYADGPIFYTDSFGTNIEGVGTVNDFTFFLQGQGSPQSVIIDGTTLFGRRLTVEAAGDIHIRLAAPITNNNIGETLKLVTNGSIIYFPDKLDGTAASTFGTAGNLFNRNLQLVASDSITLNNSIHIGASGNMMLAAYQPVQFASPGSPPGIQAATGAGNVSMIGNHLIDVGGSLTVVGKSFNITGGAPAGTNFNVNPAGQQLKVGGSLNIDLNVDVPGSVTIRGGQPGASSSSAALVEAGSIRIGSSSKPVQNFTIKSGTGTAGAAAPNAIMSATQTLSMFVSGDVEVTGGSSGSAALIQGGSVNIGGLGVPVQNLFLAGGTNAEAGITGTTGAVSVFTAGTVDLAGGTNSGAFIQGVGVNIGAAGAPVRSLALGTHGAGMFSDTRITSTGPVNVFATGDVDLVGRTGSLAVIQGTNVNIGAPGVGIANLNLTGGTGVGTLPSDARIIGTGTVSLYTFGDVDLTAGTGSAAFVQGENVNVGSGAARFSNLSLTGGTSAGGLVSDARITATGMANVFAGGNVDLKGGTENAAAFIEAANVNIGVLNNLSLTAGKSPGGDQGTAASHNADTRIVATGDLGVSVSGNIEMTGGTTNIAVGSPGAVSTSALSMLKGGNVLLDVHGNMTMTGGTASAGAGGNTADSSASIIATKGLNSLSAIAGDLTIQGGTATAIPGSGQAANAQSAAKLDTAGDLVLNVGGKLSVLGGTAIASNASGVEATASATASLNATGTKDILVGGDFIVTGGTASAAGAGATATALAGTDSGTTGFAGILNISTGGNLLVTGGLEGGTGVASAAILASGEIKAEVRGPLGLQLSGGGGTNFFQLVGTQLIQVEGKGYPITVRGPITLNNGLDRGDAFFISGAASLTLTDPQLLRSLDCIALSGGACVLPASGSRAGDPSRLATGGTCK
jgi:hypothetical protein